MSDKQSNVTRRGFISVGSAAIVSPLILNSVINPRKTFAAQSQNQQAMPNEEQLKSFKDMMNYNDAQWDTWRSNPKNLQLLEKAGEFEKYILIAEVTSSTGCAAGHRVGDRIVYVGGALVSSESPEKICFGLLATVSPVVHMLMEKIFSGEDPTKIVFTKHHCPDVGVDNGGWGEVIVEVKVEETQA